MSGKNQHYIPQLLLRAFRIAPGKTPRVYKFQAEGIFPLPTKQVAAEDWFYSQSSIDGSKTLDDLITDYEGDQLSADFKALYSAVSGPIEAALAARTIGHLFGRVGHVRGVMRSGVELLADQIELLFGGEEQLRYILGADGPLPGKRFREAFGRAMADDVMLTSLGLPGPVLESVAYSMLRESLSDGATEFNSHARLLVENFRGSADALARNAQIKSLNETLVPRLRVEYLEAFTWRIEDVGENSFILPDFVALAYDVNGQSGTLLTFDMDDLDTVLMPLSPKRMLIGQQLQLTVDLNYFNKDAVPNCLSFFVSSFKSETLSALRPAIGQRVLEPIHQALAEAASGFRRQVEQANSSTGLSQTNWNVEVPASFALQVQGYDEAGLDSVSAVLMRLVAWARNRFDISSLIRFVIADDYDQALATIDRGKLDTGETIIASKEGMSVAYNVPVEEDGRIGVAIVLRGGVPAMLLGDDNDRYAAAASIVLSQLARLGADALLDKVFADGANAGDACDRALMPRSIEVWRSYLIGCYQCRFSEGVRADHRANLLAHLEGMTDRLIAARRIYRVSADADALLNTILPDALGAVTLAGLAASGLNDDPDHFAVDTFRAALEGRGLLKWFDLLKSDLADIWHEGELYPQPEAFLVINRHVQRMLVPGVMFFWESETGPRVEVPYASDIEWMTAQAAADNRLKS